MSGGGFTVWDGISLAVDCLGLVIAIANSVRDFVKRRPKAALYVEWSVAPLGKTHRHLFFVVRVVNVRERPVLVRRIVFAGGELLEAEFETFREHPPLPVTLGDHQEARALNDPDRATQLLSELGMRTVTAIGADGPLVSVPVPEWVIDEAEELRDETKTRTKTTKTRNRSEARVGEGQCAAAIREQSSARRGKNRRKRPV